jgi:hypothetical protein
VRYGAFLRRGQLDQAKVMGADLPDYYFRVRENGAVVFRVGTENRQRRIEMDEIATVNVKNGNVKPHGEVTLTGARQEQLAAREVDDILRTVDHLNLTSQWAQSRATDTQLDAVTDALLLAMHDLRSVLVRRKADRLAKSEG